MKNAIVVTSVFWCLACPVLSQTTFPDDFLGNWKGIMNWYSIQKAGLQQVPMELHVHASGDSTEQYSWQIIYGEDRKDQRPYTLKPAGSGRGHWVIDENNGILLDHYWLGSVFSGVFSIDNSTVLSSFRIEDDQLIVEFFGFKTPAVSISGGKSPEVPKVESYQMGSYQRGVLRKN